jgi:lipoprotein Spr
VGIYVGNDKFVHASRSNGVIISNIADDYYRTSYKGSRRVLW